jgi:hypothetical protein
MFFVLVPGYIAVWPSILRRAEVVGVLLRLVGRGVRWAPSKHRVASGLCLGRDHQGGRAGHLDRFGELASMGRAETRSSGFS